MTDADTDEAPHFEFTGDKEFTLAEAAEKLCIHRVTLKRMLDSGRVIDTRGGEKKPFVARWRRLPQPHRVFTQFEVDLIRVGMSVAATEKHDVTFEEDKK